MKRGSRPLTPVPRLDFGLPRHDATSLDSLSGGWTDRAPGVVPRSRGGSPEAAPTGRANGVGDRVTFGPGWATVRLRTVEAWPRLRRRTGGRSSSPASRRSTSVSTCRSCSWSPSSPGPRRSPAPRAWRGACCGWWRSSRASSCTSSRTASSPGAAAARSTRSCCSRSVGVSKLEHLPETPRDEFAIAIVGPLTSLGLGVVALGVGASLGGSLVPDRPRRRRLVGAPRLAEPDPRRRSTCSRRSRSTAGACSVRSSSAATTSIRATRIATRVGHVLAVVLIVVGVLFDIWLTLIGMFVYFGATAEEAGTIVHVRLRGHRVRELVRPGVAEPHVPTEDEVVSIDEPLDDDLLAPVQTAGHRVAVIAWTRRRRRRSCGSTTSEHLVTDAHGAVRRERWTLSGARGRSPRRFDERPTSTRRAAARARISASWPAPGCRYPRASSSPPTPTSTRWSRRRPHRARHARRAASPDDARPAPGPRQRARASCTRRRPRRPARRSSPRVPPPGCRRARSRCGRRRPPRTPATRRSPACTRAFTNVAGVRRRCSRGSSTAGCRCSAIGSSPTGPSAASPTNRRSRSSCSGWSTPRRSGVMFSRRSGDR